MNPNRVPAVGATSQESRVRKPYSPPVLTLFGHVAALTRSGTCSANTDGNNGICLAGGNMQGNMVSSDRRLKQDIVRIGNHPSGIGLYLFRYRPDFEVECGAGRQFGVMADEVQTVLPGAVRTRPDGYLSVDYDALGIRRGTLRTSH